jgi:hypothetical protein
MTRLKAPFPAFGGKGRIASLVWSRLGDVANFVEPFANSAAVLLARPHPGRVETLNDGDAYIANFWRAIQHDPEAVATHADGPVNEADLHARHRWLVGVERPEPAVPAPFDRHPVLRRAYLAGYRGEGRSYAAGFRARMREEPDYYDPKIAGWWCWGACCWIGAGWCGIGWHGPTGGSGERRPEIAGSGGNCGVLARSGGLKRPKLSGGATDSGALGTVVHSNGPHAKMPRLTNDVTMLSHRDRVPDKMPQAPRTTGDGNGGNSRGVHAEKGPSDAHRPQLADAYSLGRGVHAGPKLSEQVPYLNAGGGTGGPSYGQGVHAGNPATLGTCAARRAWLVEWFSRLADRLRTVRVCCGHWLRVCDSDSTTVRLGTTGVFLDPPYSHDVARMLAWVAHLDGTGPEPGAAGGATNRAKDLYANDRAQDVDRLVAEVHRYCRDRGGDPRMRLALCGYAGEHDALESLGWECVAWTAAGGYGNRAKANVNRERERLWLSPHTIGRGTDPARDIPGQMMMPFPTTEDSP